MKMIVKLKSTVVALMMLSMVVAMTAQATLVAECIGGEIYDRDWSSIQKILAPSTPVSSTCLNGNGGSNVEIVQLFTPPSVPWNYTQMCFKIMLGEAGEITLNSPQNFTLVAYEDVNGAPAAEPFYTSIVTVTALVPPSGVIPLRWYTVASKIFVTRPRVHLGVRVARACSQISYYASVQKSTRLSYWRSGLGSNWTAHKADWDSDNYTSILVRARGAASIATPAGWFCSPSQYKDGLVCDCSCGAPDPDCYKVGSVSPSCNVSVGEVCNQSGWCQAINWNTAIPGCELKSFGSGDGCQCGCGSDLDPDCRDSKAGGEWYPRALNCPSSKISRCGDRGECIESWTSSDCPASAWNNSVCDCQCQSNNVLDPDCLVASYPSTCAPQGTCFEGACRPIPASWTCLPLSYGTKDGCNCSCGAFDPDCAVQTGTASPQGCLRSTTIYSCNRTGSCVVTGCGNGVVETNSEQCELNGLGCDSICRCGPGWVPNFPISSDCKPKCGDGQLVGDEECDGGKYCGVDCKCVAGHPPMNPLDLYCTGCGNGWLDAGEDCEGGEACDSNCSCIAGYRATTPPTRSCKVAPPPPPPPPPAVDSSDSSAFAGLLSSSSAKIPQQSSLIQPGSSHPNIPPPAAAALSPSYLGVYVGAPVGVVGGFAIVTMIVAVVVNRQRKNRAPNTPIDLGDVNFVPASVMPQGFVPIDPVNDISAGIQNQMPLPYIYPPGIAMGISDSPRHSSSGGSDNAASLANTMVQGEVPTYPITPRSNALAALDSAGGMIQMPALTLGASAFAATYVPGAVKNNQVQMPSQLSENSAVQPASQ